MLNKRKSALADDRTVKEVARIELNTREVGINLKLSAADRLINNCVRFALNMVKAEVVVIASAHYEVSISFVNPLAD